MKNVKSYLEELSKNKPIYYKSENMSKQLNIQNHSVIMGYLEVYEKHCPMTITQDIIWLLIVQGFTHLVLNNFGRLKVNLLISMGRKYS